MQEDEKRSSELRQGGEETVEDAIELENEIGIVWVGIKKDQSGMIVTLEK